MERIRRVTSATMRLIMALEMKPSCESCGKPTDARGEAYICTYECTFCTACAVKMKCKCPNCGGELVVRPRQGSVLSGGCAQVKRANALTVENGRD